MRTWYEHTCISASDLPALDEVRTSRHGLPYGIPGTTYTQCHRMYTTVYDATKIPILGPPLAPYTLKSNVLTQFALR